MVTVSYSELVSSDNQNDFIPYKGPKIMTKWRKEPLDSRKIAFPKGVSVDKILAELLKRISELQEGTLFRVGSLVKTERKGDAISLGHRLGAVEKHSSMFKFVTIYSGQTIYVRTRACAWKMLREEVRLLDGIVELDDDPIIDSPPSILYSGPAVTPVVFYSTLMTSDNIPTGYNGDPVRIPRRLRQRNLKSLMIDFSSEIPISEIYGELRKRVEKFPSGTLFSLKSMVSFPNRTSKLAMEHLMRQKRAEEAIFKRIEEVTPPVYIRTSVDAHLVEDISITLV